MTELLSVEERSALREPYAVPGRAARVVTPAVFPSVDQLDPERVAALTAAIRQWFERIAQDLSRQLRLACSTRPPQLQYTSPPFLPSPEEELFWADVEGCARNALLVMIPRSFAAASCERLFGAPFELRGDRELAPTEIVLIRDLVQHWLNFAREIWPGQTVSLSPPAEEDGITEPEDTSWLHFDGEIQCGDAAATLSVTLSPFAARGLMGEANQASTLPPSGSRVLTRLGEVPVEMRAVLGQASFTLDELSSLRVGDVIALDRAAQDPVDIVIEDRALFRARAGVAGQWVAIEIIGGPSQETRYEC